MTQRISTRIVAQAILTVDRMDLRAREALADEIHAHQPTLLASVLVLPRLGARLEQVEIILNILFVVYQAMKISGHAWPMVCEDLQDRCLDRLVAKMLFLDGLTTLQQAQALQQQIDSHAEPNLLAFVYSRLQDHDLLDVKTDAIMFMLLAAVNLTECVAAVCPSHTTKAVQRRTARRVKTAA